MLPQPSPSLGVQFKDFGCEQVEERLTNRFLSKANDPLRPLQRRLFIEKTLFKRSPARPDLETGKRTGLEVQVSAPLWLNSYRERSGRVEEDNDEAP